MSRSTMELSTEVKRLTKENQELTEKNKELRFALECIRDFKWPTAMERGEYMRIMAERALR